MKDTIKEGVEDLYQEHSQHSELIPTRCSECDKEVRAMGDSMISEEEDRQLTEDKRREEAEQCERDDNAKVEEVYENFDK